MLRLLPLLALLSATSGAHALDVAVTQNQSPVPRWDVVELTFTHDHDYAEPFFDADLDVTFVAPSGRTARIGGFYYGGLGPSEIIKEEATGHDRPVVRYVFDQDNLWKARFAPDKVGEWRYDYVFSGPDGEATGEGSFECVASPLPGFVRQDAENAFLWTFDDGSPYYPIGLQDGVFDNSGTGSVLDQCSMEGPFRLGRDTELPEGPEFVRGPSTSPMNCDVYFRTFADCGFNLLRFSQQNFSLSLYDDLDHWRIHEPAMIDEYIRCARKYGFRIMYGLFGYHQVFNTEPGDAEGMAKVKRFVKYSVDRWGAYVDFWEFLNEQDADDAWYAEVAPYLASIDPYGHPITTSWERPQLDGIEISAPHWYTGVDEGLNSDAQTADRAREWKSHGKPVIVGEAGNWTPTDKPNPPGVGGAWDPHSALRMRIRNWTALFSEISFVFWNTSYARDGHFMNIWLGPQEREYVAAMQDFAYRLGGPMHMAPAEVSRPQEVRAYALVGDTTLGAYLHHFASHATAVKGLALTIDVPAAATGYWYAPTDAGILGAIDLPEGQCEVLVPDFVVDIALLVTPDGPPDLDGDGVANDADPDDDNDGTPDAEDAFPLDPPEWADTDGDLIGDNTDADDDGDGTADDANANGVPDHEELDFDGDGIDRANAVPWDAFPWDPTEWADTDGDGIGDNEDAGR